MATPRRSVNDPAVIGAVRHAYRISENLPLIGGLLRRSRREVSRAASQLFDMLPRERVDIDSIVARLDVGAIVARLDLDAVVARLDIDEVVARLAVEEVVTRLDIDEIVARLDIDAVVARLDIDRIIANIDFGRLAVHVVDGVTLPGVVRKSANSLVRNRRPPASD